MKHINIQRWKFIVRQDDLPLQDALGRMTEFAMFMAKESGSQDRIDYVSAILQDDDILWEVEN